MPLEYRPVRIEEWPQAVGLDRAAFGDDDAPEWSDYWRDNAFEFDRSAGAFDGSQLVGQSMIYSLAMSVPGGNILPCGGVSWIAVRQTNRRQGIMRNMMRTQIDDIHERNEPLAALWASEAPIYGQFGFGVAGYTESWEIDARRAVLRDDISSPGQVQYVAHDEAVGLFDGPFEAAMRRYPGMVRRTPGFWTRQLRGNSPPGGLLKSHHAAYYGDSGVEGLLTYQIKDDWPDSNPDGIFELKDLIAVNDEAYAALWDFCISQDLIETITCQRPADEPLRWMLKDRRAISARSSEEFYLRLVDVPSALNASQYDTEDTIIVEVVDEFCPWNAGKYLLDTSGGGEGCSPSGQRAEVTLDARELASLYLGGVSAHALGRSGLIDDHSGDATARLDRLFSSPVHPWPHLFW